MDALSGLLDGPRARNAFLLRAVMDPPWSIRVQDESPLTVLAVVRGEAWLVGPGEPVRVGAGDVALVRGPDHYTMADSTSTAPQVVVHPGQRCTTLGGADLALEMRLGVRSWGNNLDGATVMLVGAYEQQSAVGQRVLTSLPSVMVIPAAELDSPLVQLLAGEIVKDDHGQAAVLDRLLDLLLVATLRTWFSRAEAAPAWWSAASDPIVGPALRMLHDAPAHPWTIAELAASVGVSRAGLARRFTELVGEPPIAFLTGLRLELAADLLLESDASLAAVARQVGYGSPFALSVAFKRAYGLSPQAHRRAMANSEQVTVGAVRG
jgi:AraC-like DNA-binding protein